MDDLPAPNVTRANITGKVPEVMRRVRGKAGQRKAKAVALTADKRSHVKALSKRGLISPSAAGASGLQGKK